MPDLRVIQGQLHYHQILKASVHIHDPILQDGDLLKTRLRCRVDGGLLSEVHKLKHQTLQLQVTSEFD